MRSCVLIDAKWIAASRVNLAITEWGQVREAHEHASARAKSARTPSQQALLTA
jgi:hypothetical protein